MPVTLLFLFTVLMTPGISEDTPPACNRCHDKGAIQCPVCKGRGTTTRARIECPVCKGEKTIPCEECDENGKVECDRCRLRTIDGKDVYAIVNPEWKRWKRKGSSSLTGRESNAKPETKEPAHYIECPECGGTGKRNCPVCEGTKKRGCPRCSGKGYIIAPGTCPECNGEGIVACPVCIMLPEDIDDDSPIKALMELKKKKLLTPAEYYGRLRLLAQKERAALEAEQARQEERARQEAEAEKDAAAARKREEERKAKRQAVETLIDAFESEALTLEMYVQKARLMALYPDDLWQIESESVKKHPRFARYVELKKKFRAGTLELDAFREAIRTFH